MVQKLKKPQVVSISNNSCPFCNLEVSGNLGDHIKSKHGENNYNLAVLKAKEQGIPDPKIGNLFNINFKQLQRIITEAYGVNISTLKKPKKIKTWQPQDYELERTTVWSFRRRGNWVTHDGRYRGNWSPYIPRNIILRYSNLGETVLDYFIGGGTTAVEAKLLGRRCIALDINPAAIGLTKENLKFELPRSFTDSYPIYEPDVAIGDARDLRGIGRGEIDLICAHPPYSGIISYSSKTEGDLSALSYDDFINQMIQVADESKRVLKPGGRCAILIGDTRKKKHVIPIGFRTINAFLDTGFKLGELIIKRQHNCKTTGFWYSNSIKYNFLLLAHEYLAVFEKPYKSEKQPHNNGKDDILFASIKNIASYKKENSLETTSVWFLPEENFTDSLRRNVINRYSSSKSYREVNFSSSDANHTPETDGKATNTGLLFIQSPCLYDEASSTSVETYTREVVGFVNKNIQNVITDGYLVIQTRDVRVDGYVIPLAKRLVDNLSSSNLWLKEIIIVTHDGSSENSAMNGNVDNLEITHQYLLVYEVLK